MAPIPVGHAIAEALEAEGVTTVFGIPGGHILPLYDGVRARPRLTSILVRHEHAAAAMAAAYAQLTGTPGVVLVTAGPGVTNVVTAVAEAFVGALPMIILAGRGSTATVYRGASQEVATDQILRPVTKWSTRVDRADLMVPALRQAFAISRSGKPGPVLVEAPRDILAQQIEADRYRPAGPPGRLAGDPGLVSGAAHALAAAQRPLLIAGGGVLASAASPALLRLAEQLSSPVLTSLAGRGALPEDHPLAAGGLGAHRNPVSKRLLAESDVIVGLGTRFEEMETNWQPSAMPPDGATYIQVDIDPGELGCSVTAHIGVTGDVRTPRSVSTGIPRHKGTAAQSGLAGRQAGWVYVDGKDQGAHGPGSSPALLQRAMRSARQQHEPVLLGRQAKGGETFDVAGYHPAGEFAEQRKPLRRPGRAAALDDADHLRRRPEPRLQMRSGAVACRSRSRGAQG